MLPGLTIALVITGPSASHALALTATGDCYVWGRNSNGQLGLGHTEPTPKPTALALRARGAPANAPAESIVGGAVGKAHTLLITARGTLYSCGSAAAAQLGHSGAAKQGKFVPTPRAVAWPHAAAPPCRVAAGADFSIATDTAGRLYSWGHPQYGQLGNGTTGEFLERSRRVDYAYRCARAPRRARARAPAHAWRVAGLARLRRARAAAASGAEPYLPSAARGFPAPRRRSPRPRVTRAQHGAGARAAVRAVLRLLVDAPPADRPDRVRRPACARMLDERPGLLVGLWRVWPSRPLRSG